MEDVSYNSKFQLEVNHPIARFYALAKLFVKVTDIRRK